MKIEIKANNQLCAFEKSMLDRLSSEAFPPDGDDIKWAEGSWNVLVWENDEIVSNVGVLERLVRVGSQPVRLGGIGGVATKVERRRRGLAGAALKLAQAFMRDELAVDFGLLVCENYMIPYYGKFGWQLVKVKTWIDQPQGKVAFPDPVMILPVCKSEWPDGEIDLCGMPW
jgi:aminoglycoside 2'-N-acetyltransferase I